MVKKNAIVLAAGKGTRMKSDKPKVVHNVLYKPMIKHIVDQLKKADIDEIIVVVGYKAQLVKEALKDDHVRFVEQHEQLGTGHAVLQAASVLEGQEGLTVVVNGDAPLITAETIEKFMNHHVSCKNDTTAMTANIDLSYRFGRIVRDEKGNIIRNVEYKDASVEIRNISEMNMGFYCFDNLKLFKTLKEIKNDNAQKEYYLPDVFEIGNQLGYKIDSYIVEDIDEIGGINDRVELAKSTTMLKRRVNHNHLLNGVEIIDPENTYIGVDVEIGAETVIEPGCVIKGKTKIGSHSFIGAHSKLEDVVIGEHVTILDSHIVGGLIEDHVDIGPYARLRGNCHIHKGAHLGNFVEMKATEFGENSKCSHLSYIGDAFVGKEVNIGCGTITVNYDGQSKFKTTIGDNSFVGCNSNLVAPVKVGENAFIAAGSTITDEVPDKAFAIARQRQTTKENYVDKLKENRKK